MSRNTKIAIAAAAGLVVFCCVCAAAFGVTGLLTSLVITSSSTEYEAPPVEEEGEFAPEESFENNDSLSQEGATYYEVRLVGEGFEPFDRTGCMVLAPGVSAPGNQGDANPLEVGLFSGSPYQGEAGAINWVTNTQLMCDVIPASCPTQAAALDMADVRVGDDGQQIVVTLADIPTSMTSQLNIFNARSGVTANVYQAVEGELFIEFTGDDQVRGVVDFSGRGMVSAGSARYRAEFEGEQTSFCP